MQTVKISVILCLSALLLGLAVPAKATPFSEEFAPPVYAKYEDTEFKFAIELKSSSEYIERAWFFEIGLQGGSLDKSEIKAGDSVNVEETIKYDKKTGAVKSKKVDIKIDPVLFEGRFSRFEVTPDEENVNQINFIGAFEYTLMNEEDVELLYVYGNFVPIAKEEIEPFNAFISNFDPYKPPDPSNPVPEPATMFLLGTGMICLAAVRNRRKA